MIRTILFTIALTLPAAAQDCATLAAQAGAAEGIPDGLLPAIALVESGHGDGKGGRAPWPWTLNQGGKSHYLDSKDAALARVQDILSDGTTNVDLGCMQLNWRWHAKAFSGPEEMLDPVANTAYAARFLKELKNQLGSWELATAAYHSTDPERGKGYVARVTAAQDALADGQASPELLLAAVPLRLDGLLAIGEGPLFAAAAARVALVQDEPEEIATEAQPQPRPQAASRRGGPDIPLVRDSMVVDPLTEDGLRGRLRGRWKEVSEMRVFIANIR